MSRKTARRRAILDERVHILMRNALSNARSNPRLAVRQAALARRLCSRHRAHMPYQLRMLFCKQCKSFIVPGISSRVRMGRSNIRSVRTTCGFCGHVYRKILTCNTAQGLARQKGAQLQ